MQPRSSEARQGAPAEKGELLLRGAWSTAKVTERDFARIARFVTETAGIQMPTSKRLMMESRLRKRLRDLGLDSFEAYCDHAFGPRGANERVHLIDALTTNKTDFFREPHHFDFLLGTALGELARRTGAGFRRPFQVWSAGCSSGEEPYTLAMVLSEVAAAESSFRFHILATDLSTRILAHAKRGVYVEERIAPVSAELRRKYLMRSRERAKKLVRVAPEVRRLVEFRQLNFMDDDFGLRTRMDVIFCRNVLIYFDRARQEALLRRFCAQLAPGGFLFLGHSESIHGFELPLDQTAPTVYRIRS